MIEGQNEVNRKWIGCTLGLKFIFDEVKKIGALPKDHAEWIYPMVDSIEIPDVPVRIRNMFLPSHEDAHMEHVDDEDEMDLINEWSREAAVFSDQLGEHLIELITQHGPSTIKLFITIQKFARGFLSRRDNSVEKVVSAILIQKIYRGYRERGMRYYETVGEARPYRRYRRVCKKSIRFINTGPVTYNYAWIRRDGVLCDHIEIGGKTLEGKNISTYVSHCFAIYSNHVGEDGPNQSEIRYIRVNSGTKSVFDVNTGISLSNQHWNEMRLLSDGGFIQSNTMTEEMMMMDDDEARFQLAVQLSLEMI